jgi:branched-chain amino acid transport system substrate-binding protein
MEVCVSGARLAQALVVVAAASLALSGCGAKSDNSQGGGGTSAGQAAPAKPSNAADPKGDGNAKCSGVSLAYIGTIAGKNAALGLNELKGIKLAVEQHNQANKGCQVTLKQFDSGGTPDTAPGVVTQAINEPEIIGVLGLPFSGESKAVGAAFNSAGLVTITSSATNPSLSKNGWKTFFRGLGNDAAQGPAAAKFITENLKATKVCVIQDDSDYGMGLAKTAIDALGSKASCQDKVKTGQTDFAAVVSNVQSQKPDAVFYAGYYTEAAPLAQQLNDKGVKAKFVGPDGVKDEEFVKNAGDAAANAYFTCPCVPADAFTDFSSAYKKATSADPGTYSAEAYDAATIELKGIDSGIKDRAGMLNFVKNYDGQGLTTHFKWDATGELAVTSVWTYKVVGGQIVKNVEITSK